MDGIMDRCGGPQKRRRCMRAGPITSNGYLNYLRVFRRKVCGLSPTETVRQGAKCWNKLSSAQKDMYRKVGIRRGRGSSGACKCVSKRKRSSSRQRHRSRSRRRSKSRSSRRGCIPRRTRKNKRRRSRGKRRSGKRRCMRPGPVTINPYLNFLRCYRKCHCGLTATEVVRRGARKWCSMSAAQQAKYRTMRKRTSRKRRC